jgi:hypothetical protein
MKYYLQCYRVFLKIWTPEIKCYFLVEPFKEETYVLYKDSVRTAL